ncbi:hypothetical protein [Methanosarcina sp. 2.H.A.1B.4]|nr:hypothetical protein [Methanosarcina sp. 2.H.A.1B.4]
MRNMEENQNGEYHGTRSWIIEEIKPKNKTVLWYGKVSGRKKGHKGRM